MPIKFICTDFDGNSITVETQAENISEVVHQFRLFLLGAGFSAETVNEYIQPD